MKLLFTLLGVALGLYAVFALGSNLLYWRCVRRFPCAALPAPAFSGRAFAAMLWRTVVSQLWEMLCVPKSIYLRKRFEHATTRHAPVLLVHGIYQNQASWFGMQKALYGAGYASTCYVYRSFYTSLEGLADGLEEAVDRLERRFPGKKPVVLGHSLGGLIVRLWLMRPGNGQRLGGVITFGTPHEGSQLAHFAPGQLAKSLCPGSLFLRQLAAAHTAPSFPAHAFCSPTDESVQPAASLLPPAGWQLHGTEPCSHLGLLFNNNVIARCISLLGQIAVSESPI
ncbi:esterase/lipase family protein [Desulfovibrio cuneatus]|uniref:esterase/lipase family protein n=1 Tax=Desulfovibrio cuneatus TaxID=159728 RepID=UPI000426BFFE|nr:alpha/beta fold hydrolase [Desulfovibrio cuneatus]